MFKADKDKLRFSLLPWKSLTEVVRVFEHGARKYSVDGWKTVPGGRERYTEAIGRHFAAIMCGEKVDEDGLNHLACIAANAMIVLALTPAETAAVKPKLKHELRGSLLHPVRDYANADSSD